MRCRDSPQIHLAHQRPARRCATATTAPVACPKGSAPAITVGGWPASRSGTGAGSRAAPCRQPTPPAASCCPAVPEDAPPRWPECRPKSRCSGPARPAPTSNHPKRGPGHADAGHGRPLRGAGDPGSIRTQPARPTLAEIGFEPPTKRQAQCRSHTAPRPLRHQRAQAPPHKSARPRQR